MNDVPQAESENQNKDSVEKVSLNAKLALLGLWVLVAFIVHNHQKHFVESLVESGTVMMMAWIKGLPVFVILGWLTVKLTKLSSDKVMVTNPIIFSPLIFGLLINLPLHFLG